MKCLLDGNDDYNPHGDCKYSHNGYSYGILNDADDGVHAHDGGGHENGDHGGDHDGHVNNA